MIKFLIPFILLAALPTCVLADDSFVDRANGYTALATISDNENLALETNSNWQNRVQELLINALSLTGIQYTYGGKTPETGFDCSGFVRYVFSHAANLTLPHSARAISQIGKTVKKEELQPGDLVFFNTLKSAFSHVGIYLGDNKFIHAPRTGAAVRVEKMDTSYWASRFNGGQRLEKEVEAKADIE
jgi:cell wall-associated NlpC family hydrolase